MTDLTTTYLGMRLNNPLVAGAGPLTDDLDMARRLEDAGCAALVMRSLCEEQVERETRGSLDGWAEPHSPAIEYLTHGPRARFTPTEYVEHVRRLKGSVKIPVIASLNGVTDGAWLEYGSWLEQAGADAIELNTYHMVTDPHECAAAVERRLLDMVRALKGRVRIPIAAKLSPFYSALPHLAVELERAGASGVVLFNRFFQPDVDIDRCALVPSLHLSDPSELLLRLRWLAALAPIVHGSMACSGGVHGATDALKACLVGAHAVQMTSALLRHGPGRLEVILEWLREWLDERGYASLRALRGCLDLSVGGNPQALERANYVRFLQAGALWPAPWTLAHPRPVTPSSHTVATS